MSCRDERRVFVAAALALWLLFFLQAVWSPILLDDWFQIRYWNDHDFTWRALWDHAQHDYLHYNPRIGEVFLSIVDGSRTIHLVVTPLVQLALPPLVFAIAFGRLPRPNLADLELLLFVQVTIWLVIPIPGILYFYRPFTTNYLWGFTFTLALFVPYRLALAGDDARPRRWLAPIVFVLGWIAGMANEHTGPTAMLAMAAFVGAAWHRRRLRAWMLAGLAGLYVGYPMLFFAPGQSVRYGGQATRDTPTRLLAQRGVLGCLDIILDFVRESWLGILLFVAALAGYAIRRRALPAISRDAATTAALLAGAAVAIVMTLFVSPTTTDRVFFASGTLLAAAFAVGAHALFGDRDVRRFVTGAVLALAAYHAARFVETALRIRAENADRLAILASARPGSVPVVPAYARDRRSRWSFGEDFVEFPWLRAYVGTTMYDLAGVDLERPLRAAPRYLVTATYDPPLVVTTRVAQTYRRWLADPASPAYLAALARPGHRLVQLRIDVQGVPLDDPQQRRLVAASWSATDGAAYVDGRPYDEGDTHYIRVLRSTIARDATWSISGCGWAQPVVPLDGGRDAILLPVDERFCRGPFTAAMCVADRCWVAGWY